MKKCTGDKNRDDLKKIIKEVEALTFLEKDVRDYIISTAQLSYKLGIREGFKKVKKIYTQKYE